MVEPVDFEDDPLAVRHQEQEVHAVSQQGIPATFTDRLGVPVQPYFGQQCGEVGYGAAVDLVVKVVQLPLRRRAAGKAADEPLVQGSLGLVIVGEMLGVLPPFLQIPPPDAVTADGPVVDEDLVRVLSNLDVVVDGVAEPYVGLRERREDEVLRLPVACRADWDDAEHRVAAVGARLTEFRPGRAQVGVDDADGVSLRWLVGNDVGGDQPLKKPREPRVARLERAELLEQVLSGPVAGVAEHVPFDLPAQARRGACEEVEWAVVQYPQAVQEGSEPVSLVCQDIEVEVPGDLVPAPPRYLRSGPASPKHVLDRIAGRWT